MNNTHDFVRRRFKRLKTVKHETICVLFLRARENEIRPGPTPTSFRPKVTRTRRYYLYRYDTRRIIRRGTRRVFTNGVVQIAVYTQRYKTTGPRLGVYRTVPALSNANRSRATTIRVLTQTRFARRADRSTDDLSPVMGAWR